VISRGALLLCRSEQRPPRLDLGNYPHLPLAPVVTTEAADYMALLPEVAQRAAQRSMPLPLLLISEQRDHTDGTPGN